MIEMLMFMKIVVVVCDDDNKYYNINDDDADNCEYNEDDN